MTRARIAVMVTMVLVTVSLLLAWWPRTRPWFSWRDARRVSVTIIHDPAPAADEATSSPSTNPNGILYWTCPMHADVKEAKPGKHDAAHCGMDLVPVYAKNR